MQKDMQGVLFPVKAEDTSDYDYTGWCYIEGGKYGLRVTIKRSKSGDEFMKIESEDGLDGAMFFREKQTDRHPDLKGSVKIRKDKFWVSAWMNHSEKKNKDYVSLKFNQADLMPVNHDEVPHGTPVIEETVEDDRQDNLPF